MDKNLEITLDRLTSTLHKKKSDVIRDAISFYANNVEKSKKTKILKAVEKTKNIDRKEFMDFEDTINPNYAIEIRPFKIFTNTIN